MIVPFWSESFRARYGGAWPTSYAAFDLETTGFDMKYDVILNVGHVLVEDGKVVDRLSLFLDWSNHNVVPDHWLRTRLDKVGYQMRESGRSWHVDYDRLKREGLRPPEKALEFYVKFFRALADRGVPAVAHNGYGFDERMLCANVTAFGVAETFSFGDDGLFDTDCIEKANQLTHDRRFHPKEGDTLRAYFNRVKYTRVGGVKSDLDNHCRLKYDFQGRGVSPEAMHDAEVDAYCVHLLMQEFGKAAGRAELKLPVFPQGPRRGQTLVSPTPVRPGAPRLRGQRNR